MGIAVIGLYVSECSRFSMNVSFARGTGDSGRNETKMLF